ncbi:acid-sensing ion channel 5-like [Pelodytes ibericus]
MIEAAAKQARQRRKNELWEEVVEAVDALGGNNKSEEVVKKSSTHRQPALHIRLTDGEDSQYMDNANLNYSSMFLSFDEKYQKKYPPGSQIFQERYKVFLKSIERHVYLNKFAYTSNGEEYYGINRFSDLTAEEFSNTYLKTYPIRNYNFVKPSTSSQVKNSTLRKSLPLRFDWRNKNVVMPVKNQMTCGACWAFSVVGAVESAYAIKGHQPQDLSVQQVIDCSYMNSGCNGGSTVGAFIWLNQTQVKLVRATEYAYKAESQACHYFPLTEIGVSIKGYEEHYFSCEDEMAMKLINYGPLVVIVNAVSWQDYLGGIIQHHCSSGHPNHAVLVVGYDKTGDTPHWIVQNSWGISWGAEGYVYIKMGENICGKFSVIQSYLRTHSAPSLEERKKYHQHFAISTSFHGLHNLVNNSNNGTERTIRKVIWMSVVTFFTIMAFWQVCLRFINYISRPTTTSVTVQYVEDIEFPSVTFCNLNRFQTKAVTNLSIAFFMWNIVSAVLHSPNSGNDVTDLHEVTDFLQRNQNFSIKEFTKNNGFYLNNSTLLKCSYFGIPCSEKDFEHIFTEYGNCFTFNHNGTPSRRASSAGSGLSLLFDIKQPEFTDEPSMGFVDAGITFVIHSSKTKPRFDGLGLHSAPGMHAHASIQHFKTVMQEYPWGQCDPSLKLKYHEIYSTYGCLQECKSHYIQEECGCLPFLLPGIGTECDIQQLYNCVSSALYRIEKLDICSVGTYNSTCPVPCEETNYPTTISYSLFPSDKAAEYFSTKLSRNTTYMRDNLVFIDIKYHELNYKITKQQKALSPTELISDVGGQLGLFCGASMITIIEILEYLFTNLYWLCICLLLKTPNMHQWTANQSRYKKEIQEC